MVVFAEGGAQAGGQAEAGAQVEGMEAGPGPRSGAAGPANWDGEDVNAGAGLGEFLQVVVDEVEKILQENATSTAFAAPRQLADDSEAGVDPAFSLSPFPEGENLHSLVCTGVSWSCTGQAMAACFGRHNITGWCEYPGILGVWRNLDRWPATGLGESMPDVSVETDVCLMCCEFHPQHPALLAGGTYSGEVYVWDLSREGDAQRFKSVITELSHREPIVQVAWHFSTTEAGRRARLEEAYHLLSLGADGKLLVWNWAGSGPGVPVFGYELLQPHPETHEMVCRGGSCFAFQNQGLGKQSTSFLIGTDTGDVFRGLLDHNDAAIEEFNSAVAKGQVPRLRSPVQAEYESHDGPVHAIEWSPFQRNLFLTAGSDSCIKIFHTLQPQPLALLEPTHGSLLSAQWSPSRPLVVAAVESEGRFFIYDLASDSLHPSLAVDVSGSSVPVYALAFNPKEPSMLATGDIGGARVWNLGERLVSSLPHEHLSLEKFAQIL